jgi:hypothetical protein
VTILEKPAGHASPEVIFEQVVEILKVVEERKKAPGTRIYILD